MHPTWTSSLRRQSNAPDVADRVPGFRELSGCLSFNRTEHTLPVRMIKPVRIENSRARVISRYTWPADPVWKAHPFKGHPLVRFTYRRNLPEDVRWNADRENRFSYPIKQAISVSI